MNPGHGIPLHLVQQVQVGLRRHQAPALAPVVGIPTLSQSDMAQVAAEVAHVPAMDHRVEPEGDSVVVAAGHRDQRGDALRPQADRGM